jgi:DNA-binding PadR family transcriptional regulator
MLDAWREKRRDIADARVLAVCFTQPHEHLYGYDLRKQTGLRSGRLYPALQRLLDVGWLTDGWQSERRYYQLAARYRPVQPPSWLDDADA